MNGSLPLAPSGLAPVYRCWAEVDLDALRENLAWIRHRVGPDVQIMTVVKADAYGHGLKQIAGHLMRCGTDVFGVANLTEARAIRSVGGGWPILMLGACLPQEAEAAVRDGVQVTVSSLAEAQQISSAATALRSVARVHLKVDTGMGRLGASCGEAPGLTQQIAGLPHLVLEGVYTHFASAEDDGRFTARQRRRFREVLAQLRRVRPGLVHACNSAGLLLEPSARFNLVRPGLLVYGVPPRGRRRIARSVTQRFRPALALKARIARVREVPRGTTVSYGHTFTAPRRIRLGTVTAGYGDGYPIAASGAAWMLVAGQRCPVLGRVTMDQTLLDLSAVPEAAPGDEVVLVGTQGRETIDAADLAGWCGTIPWDILTGISYRVPRIYHGAQAS